MSKELIAFTVILMLVG